MAERRLTLSKAAFYVLLSVLIVSGSGLVMLLMYQHIRKNWIHDDKYKIVAIIQTGPVKEALPTVLLAELLDLSVDKPTNLYRFDTKAAEQKLRAFPVIQSAIVKRIKPGSVYVDYSLRTPIAYLVDLTNTAVDVDGVIFPFAPYFTPKNLPEVYLGLDEGSENVQWGSNVSGKKLDLAWNILKLIETKLPKEYTKIKRIDVSHAWAPTHGLREIIVILEDQVTESGVLKINESIIRFNHEDYASTLSDYKKLYSKMDTIVTNEIGKDDKVVKTKPVIVDMRIKDLSYVKQVE
jgi:hypothetical protein